MNKLMSKALVQARKAYIKNEVPVGAVIINAQGIIVAQAHNQVETKKSQLAHAELLAIQKATKKIKDWRLDGYTMVVTLEPCTMCLMVMKMHRITSIVYGAASPLYGFSVDKSLNLDINKAHFTLTSRILEKEASELLRSFFKNQRIEKSERRQEPTKSKE